MIAQIRGILAQKAPGEVIVDVGGVGYQVFIPLTVFYKLPEPGSEVALQIHTHLREDALQLFGFHEPQDKQVFLLLTSVAGIGPRLAINILSGIPAAELKAAIKTGDQLRLISIPGVGKKLAERMILELKDKLMTVETPTDTASRSSEPRLMQDAVSALMNLGYRQGEVEKNVRDAIQSGRTRGRDPILVDTAGRLHTRANLMNELDKIRRVAARAAEGAPHDANLRPRGFDEYIGQDQVKENLKVAIAAARGRGEVLDHLLFHGPPGLGKTSLAYIIAREMGVNIKATSGPVIERPGDLAALLTNLEEGDILFIDEIHRLNHVVEEVLYPAMEDYQIDILIGQGPAARSMKLALKPFTLIGATTRSGLLTSPLRDRFGAIFRLDFYSPGALGEIIKRSASILDVAADAAGISEIARRSRGTPRIANRLLRRVRDYAQVRAAGKITKTVTEEALKMLEVDPIGLDKMDTMLLLTMIEKFSGGPVGVETLAAAIGEEKDTIEDVYEPFLIQAGFVHRTPRGRVATQLAYEHFGRRPGTPNVTKPKQQPTLF